MGTTFNLTAVEGRAYGPTFLLTAPALSGRQLARLRGPLRAATRCFGGWWGGPDAGEWVYLDAFLQESQSTGAAYVVTEQCGPHYTEVNVSRFETLEEAVRCSAYLTADEVYIVYTSRPF